MEVSEHVESSKLGLFIIFSERNPSMQLIKQICDLVTGFMENVFLHGNRTGGLRWQLSITLAENLIWFQEIWVNVTLMLKMSLLNPALIPHCPVPRSNVPLHEPSSSCTTDTSSSSLAFSIFWFCASYPLLFVFNLLLIFFLFFSFLISYSLFFLSCSSF